MSAKPILIDTCVLFTGEVRKLLLIMAKHNILQPYWSEIIFEEWRRNSKFNIEDQITALKNDYPSALVTDFEDMIHDIQLRDKDDRHVIAAAFKAKADLIITFNIKDFPYMKLHPYQLDKSHPDIFCLNMIKAHQGIIEDIKANISLDELEKCNLTKTINYLKQ